MKFLSLVFCVVGGIFLAPFLVRAADAGLTVTPVFQEVTLEVDQEEAEFFVTLTNDTDLPIVLRSSVADFGSLDESGGVAFLGASDNLVRKFALASWMRPEKDVISLASGESEELRVVIENRESLSPGGHYGAVLFRIGEEEIAASDATVAVNQMISVLVFAKKQGGEVYNLELLDYAPVIPLLQKISQVRLRFQNNGNVHVIPRGTMTLKDPVGRIVEKGIINEESGLILPETQRTWVAKLMPLSFLVLPGYYTLSLEYRYDGKDSFAKVEQRFFLVPWPGVAFLAVCMGFLWVRWKRKK